MGFIEDIKPDSNIEYIIAEYNDMLKNANLKYFRKEELIKGFIKTLENIKSKEEKSEEVFNIREKERIKMFSTKIGKD